MHHTKVHPYKYISNEIYNNDMGSNNIDIKEHIKKNITFVPQYDDFKIYMDDIKNSDLFTNYECSICYAIFDAPLKIKCGHWFCKECLTEYKKSVDSKRSHDGLDYTCPLCRQSFLECDVESMELSFDSKKNQIILKHCTKCYMSHEISYNCQKYCRICNKIFPKIKLKHHIKYDCVIEKCFRCELYFNKTDIKSHICKYKRNRSCCYF